MASKTLKTVNKQLSEMGKEIDKVGETSSTAPLTEKFEEVEHRKIEIEAQLLERVSYITCSQVHNICIVIEPLHFFCRMPFSKKRPRNGNSANESCERRRPGWKRQSKVLILRPAKGNLSVTSSPLGTRCSPTWQSNEPK